MNRRQFVATAISAAAAGTLKAGGRKRDLNDTVTLAIMGLRGQGRSLTRQFASLPDVDIVFLCDVDERVLGEPARLVEGVKGRRPRLISDIRRALDDKSVDAVVVATPDHWHGPATLLACQAGKDVYVEKPPAHNFREGQMMVEASRRYGRVVQVGTQYRSLPSTQRAIEYIRTGRIGKVLMAKAWNVQLRENIGHRNDSEPPPEVDYETWVGPAPMLPFNENRFHYKWHWHWNFGTGDIGNDGIHQLDLCRWALGVEYPTEVSGMGRKLFFEDDQQTPDTMSINFNYPNRVIVFEMRTWNPYGMAGTDNALAVYGSEGCVHIGRWNGRSGFKVFDGSGHLVHYDGTNEPHTHAQNFIDCIRSRKTSNADIETGHISATLSHLGNIVARTGRHLRFDGEGGTIPGDEEARNLLGREYRDHWATPNPGNS